MRCEQPTHRGLGGWIALAVLAGLVVFYGYVFSLIRAPNIDEPFRRTFLTGEFSAYPTSAWFKGRNGLEYRPGTKVDMKPETARMYLARFEWRRFDPVISYLLSFTGRLFIHVPDELRKPDKPHRLQLGLSCHMPAGVPATLTIKVNGTAVGTADCADQGPFTFTASLPPGLLPQQAYDEIAVIRSPNGFMEKVATRVGLRYRAVALDWFQIDTVD